MRTRRSPTWSSRESPWNAWSASSEKTTASHRLDRAQGVHDAAALEVALAAEIRRGLAQHPLDLARRADQLGVARHQQRGSPGHVRRRHARPVEADRKSTRLNSSHTVISYAVFCLKKKT